MFLKGGAEGALLRNEHDPRSFNAPQERAETFWRSWTRAIW